MPLEESIVVFNIGSQNTKVGFAGESFPRFVMRTLVGRFRHKGFMDGAKLIYLGDEAVRNRGILNLKYPVQNGRVTDWDDMEKLWHNIFYSKLHVPPENAKVVHSVHPLATVKEKQTIAEILFEVFAIKGLLIAKDPILALYASGRTTGLVLTNGHSCCHATPVFEGFPLEHAIITTDLTGQAASEYLNSLLRNVGYQLTTPVELDILDKMKASLCYVSHDFASEYEALQRKDKVRYRLPDGQFIDVGTEQIQCPEMFFQPSLAGKKEPSLPDLIYNSIDKCDMDIRSLLFNNIVLSGGSTMFPGMLERLREEVQAKIKNQPGFNAKVHGIPNRALSVWAGGSMVASMSTVTTFWLTGEEYADSGVESVVYKFF